MSRARSAHYERLTLKRIEYNYPEPVRQKLRQLDAWPSNYSHVLDEMPFDEPPHPPASTISTSAPTPPRPPIENVAPLPIIATNPPRLPLPTPPNVEIPTENSSRPSLNTTVDVESHAIENISTINEKTTTNTSTQTPSEGHESLSIHAHTNENGFVQKQATETERRKENGASSSATESGAISGLGPIVVYSGLSEEQLEAARVRLRELEESEHDGLERLMEEYRMARATVKHLDAEISHLECVRDVSRLYQDQLAKALLVILTVYFLWFITYGEPRVWLLSWLLTP
eukprot:comp18033_c0_seq1/m.18550 comp18033_c0_seq1/g.18550  ORF comp18033_c0_seq1/g.18550 comp18033_c0_seq1/m.18550 type:complete len:287 (-) comp18033_c0_seq1:376-1236(-)